MPAANEIIAKAVTSESTHVRTKQKQAIIALLGRFAWKNFTDRWAAHPSAEVTLSTFWI